MIYKKPFQSHFYYQNIRTNKPYEKFYKSYKKIKSYKNWITGKSSKYYSTLFLHISNFMICRKPFQSYSITKTLGQIKSYEKFYKTYKKLSHTKNWITGKSSKYYSTIFQHTSNFTICRKPFQSHSITKNIRTNKLYEKKLHL